jgi:AcrR family transcriptional regulator
MSVVTRGGLSALSMSALARQLETSVSGLYRYVAGIEEVHVLLQERAIGVYEETLIEATKRFNSVISKQGVDEHGVVVARVLFVFTFHHRFCDERPAEYQIIDGSLSDPRPILTDESARHVDARLQALFSICVEHLYAAVACGAMDEGDHLQRTHVLWAALYGLGHFKKRDRIQPDSLKVIALVRATMTTVLRGYGVSVSCLERAWKLLDSAAPS